MAKDMTLLWGPGSPPCWRVMIALEEKNLQGCNQTQLSFAKMEHKSQQVMDMNPRGQLPSFKHGDRILNESYAACIYLEDQFKSQGTKLMPDCPAELAMVYQRMFEVLTLNQKMAAVLYYKRMFQEEERHDSALKRFKEWLYTELKLWEGYLEKVDGQFVAGKDFTMADVMFYPSVACAFYYGLCEERFPKLAAYYHALEDRPSFKATWPPNWLEGPPAETHLKDV